MDDTRLIKKIIAGDKKATQRFYKKYSKKLSNFVLIKVADSQDAEEILQDTFVSAIDSLPRFAGQSSLFTWLAAIAKYEVADFYRKQKIKKVLFSRLPFLERLASQVLGPEEELARPWGIELYRLLGGAVLVLEEREEKVALGFLRARATA